MLKIQDSHLYVERLDMTDGTPVLDLKPYIVGFDSIFSARSSRDLTPRQDHTPERDHKIMLQEAVNFHGELCPGVALGVRMVFHMKSVFGVAQKDPQVVLLLGKDGCICDALQGLCGATFGKGRLQTGYGSQFGFRYGDRELLFQIKELPEAPEVLLHEPIDNLFNIEQRPTP